MEVQAGNLWPVSLFGTLGAFLVPGCQLDDDEMDVLPWSVRFPRAFNLLSTAEQQPLVPWMTRIFMSAFPGSKILEQMKPSRSPCQPDHQHTHCRLLSAPAVTCTLL